MYSLEQAFAKNWLLKSVITKIEKDFSKKYLESIANDKISPYKNLKDELEHIKLSSAGNSAAKVVNSNEEINLSKINLVIATEGLHCFQNTYDTSNRSKQVSDIKQLESERIYR